MAYIDKYGVEFSDDRKTLIKCPQDFVGEYEIPHFVTSIGDSSFSGCTNLTSLTIPNSVTSIGEEAFASSGLVSIEIPSSVISIGDKCFYNCQKMEKVTFHASKHGMKHVGNDLFWKCNSIENIHVVGQSDLSQRDGESFVYRLYSIGGVLYCNKLHINALMFYPRKKKSPYFKIPDFVQEIKRYAFRGGPYLKTIRFSSVVLLIRECAFYGNFDEIIVPPDSKDWFISIKGLSHMADIIKEDEMSISDNGKIFIRCSPNIEGKFVIPDGIEIIKSESFIRCLSSSITIPSSVREIEDGAFKRCGKLTAIIVDENNPYYSSLDGVLYNKDMSILIQCPEGKTLQIIPESVVQIAPDALDWSLSNVVGSAKERVIAIRQEAQRKREQEEREKKLLEEKAREEAKRIAEEKEIQRRNQEREAREQEQLQAQQFQEMLQDSILFFDTETTGVPRSYNKPVSDSDNWPRLVQLAWLMADKNGNILKRKSVIIKPNGFSIPQGLIHGITTERALREGQLLGTVLEDFMDDVQLTASVVGHNVDFDMHIVGAELYRLDMDYNLLMDKPCICTMKSSTDFCAIPNPNSYYGGYKWPSLQELYRKLFNRDFADAHDAMADISATKECFFELKRRSVI